MRTIDVRVDPRDFDDLADELRRYARQLRGLADEFTMRLCEVAADEARSLYSDDITVETTADGVVAAGESVVFEEFGAGARISDPFPDGADVSFEIRRGAYSDLHQGEYSRSGYERWHHNGDEYRFVTPTNALFFGKEKAIEEIGRIAREVFDQ